MRARWQGKVLRIATWSLWLAAGGLLLAGAPVLGGEEKAVAEAEQPSPPTIEAVYVEEPPTIDGQLDEPCWSQAARLEGLFCPDLDQPVPEETIGLVCVDEEAIYVGIICRDRTPDDIRAVETRRNGAIGRDDYAGISLDPAHGHQDSYSFYVTARGTQAEAIPGGSATKIEWRGDWKGAATRTADGYQVEIAIPFSILRYPRGQSTFGLSLFRHFADEQITVAYPDMGKAWNPSLTADLVGLHPPHFPPRPIYMPFAVFDLGQSAGRTFNAGLDVQCKLESGLTALGTYRPDYTQIEQVVEPVSFSYTERELPEVRPFFVTGSSAYFPGDFAFYSRRIQDFDSGVKLFGEVGKEKIGLLDAIRFGEENSFVCTWQHNFTDTFNTGLHTVQHQEAGEPSNSVYQFEIGNTWRRPEGSDMLWGTVLRSFGPGADGAVYSMYTVHDRGEGNLHYEAEFGYSSPDYHPALGYYYGQDTYNAALNLSTYYRYEKGGLQSRSWSVGAEYFPYVHEEGIYHSRLGGDYNLGWRNGRSLGLGFTYGLDYNQQTTDVHGWFGWNRRDLYRGGGLGVLRGVRAGGDYTDLTLSQGFRPWKRVSLRAALEYSHLEPPSPDAYHAYQTVVTTSYDLTPEKCISARLIARDAGVTGYAAYRQVVRRGMEAYVLLGDPDPGRTGVTQRLALKLIWTL